MLFALRSALARCTSQATLLSLATQLLGAVQLQGVNGFQEPFNEGSRLSKRWRLAESRVP